MTLQENEILVMKWRVPFGRNHWSVTFVACGYVTSVEISDFNNCVYVCVVLCCV